MLVRPASETTSRDRLQTFHQGRGVTTVIFASFFVCCPSRAGASRVGTAHHTMSDHDLLPLCVTLVGSAHPT